MSLSRMSSACCPVETRTTWYPSCSNRTRNALAMEGSASTPSTRTWSGRRAVRGFPFAADAPFVELNCHRVTEIRQKQVADDSRSARLVDRRGRRPVRKCDLKELANPVTAPGSGPENPVERDVNTLADILEQVESSHAAACVHATHNSRAATPAPVSARANRMLRRRSGIVGCPGLGSYQGLLQAGSLQFDLGPVVRARKLGRNPRRSRSSPYGVIGESARNFRRRGQRLGDSLRVRDS